LTERSYNNNRWYRPGWARYSQVDPIGEIGGLDVYGYGFSNPMRKVDFFGLWSISIATEIDPGVYAQITYGSLDGVEFITASLGVGGAGFFSWDPNGGPPTAGLKKGWGEDTACRSDWISISGTAQAGAGVIIGLGAGVTGGIKADQPNWAPWVPMSPGQVPGWLPTLPRASFYGGGIGAWDLGADPNYRVFLSKVLSFRQKLKAGWSAGAQVDLTLYSRTNFNPNCTCELK
jgi:hypothetical protein